MTERAKKLILAFALVCVAVTSGFVMVMSYWLVEILSAPEWCSRAINAEKLSTVRSTSEIGNCSELLLKQIGSLALNSHILISIIALCLLVLMVIVVAGGEIRLKASKTGVDTAIGKSAAASAAAEETAQAAVDKAEQIAEALPGEDEK